MRIPEIYLGKPVRSLQTMLRLIADTSAHVLPVIPSGYYAMSTHAAVRSFQAANGLPQTGEADAVTWAAVANAYEHARFSQLMPAILPIWRAEAAIHPGEENYHLYLVQAMLAALAQFFSELDAPVLSGSLDAATEQGLRWVQRLSALPETGVLDTATWHYLNGLYRTTVGNGKIVCKNSMIFG